MYVLQTNFGAEAPLVIVGERLKCPWLEDLLGFSGEERNRASSYW